MAVKIVTKELALKLKKLGFDMPVTRAYKPNKEEYFVQRSECNSNNAIFKPSFSAPSYDEVLHWLRDKHGFNARPVHAGKHRDKVNYFAALDVYEIDGWEDNFGLLSLCACDKGEWIEGQTPLILFKKPL